MKPENIKLDSKPKIYGPKILQPSPGAFNISIKHTGSFRLFDYEELDFEVISVKLVKRKEGYLGPHI